ncbi:MAG TPA: hypothetical protein VI729_09090, partial [Anaerolineales bacterium]|nr:hypothetical protein [Anaerolineales bacterium]
GPIRSGRVGYQEIKLFYPGALLIIRFGSPEVIEQLTNSRTVYADDPNDVNSASLTLTELQALELDPARPSSYAGLSFDPRVPAGGDLDHDPHPDANCDDHSIRDRVNRSPAGDCHPIGWAVSKGRIHEAACW